LPATVEGVTISLVDENTVHFDIPDGSTVEVCVKAGSIKQGNGPEYTDLDGERGPCSRVRQGAQPRFGGS
jgi:hypothetical protein